MYATSEFEREVLDRIVSRAVQVGEELQLFG